MSTLTLEEVQKDKEFSKTDIEALSWIVQGIERFMYNPCGENRSDFRVDLMKYESLLSEALTKVNSALALEVANLKTQIETGKERHRLSGEVTKGVWKTHEEQFAVQREQIEKLTKENEELRYWNESMIKATPDWQEIGRVLGVRLGSSISDKIIPTFQTLTARIKELEEILNGRGMRMDGNCER